MKLNFKGKRIKKNLIGVINKKKLKYGSYSMFLTVLVLAIAVVVNLLAGELPSKYTQIDVSEEKLYTIGDQTEEVLKNLEEDVTIYRIVQSGNEDETITKLLERYEDASSHIKVEEKDPVVNPSFTSEYTQDTLTDNSLIVTCQDKNKIVDYNSLYEQSMDYTSYSYSVTGFDGEGQITSAIAYVTSDDLPKLYVLEGHGESTLSSTIEESIKKDNIDIETLNLVNVGEVPEDTDCILINSPQTDLSESEKEAVLDYLESGGKALIFSDYTTSELTNFDSLLANYGVERVDGVIFEGDNQHYVAQMPYYLLPEMNESEITTNLVSDNRYILMPVAQGIKQSEDARDTLNIVSLLSTTGDAYSKVNTDSTTVEKEEGDIDGPFDIGVSISEEVDDENSTQIVYFSSSALMQEQIDQMVSGSNTQLITDSLSWMCKQEESVSIPVKSVETSYLTITGYDVSFWSITAMILIPGVFLVTGFVIWLKRRKA